MSLRVIISTLAVFTLATLAVACGDTFDSCGGDQSNYDAAFAACRADGQRDKCAGADQGASYNNDPYDVCSDNIGDKGIDGCEAGYLEGFRASCES